MNQALGHCLKSMPTIAVGNTGHQWHVTTDRPTCLNQSPPINVHADGWCKHEEQMCTTGHSIQHVHDKGQ